MAKTFFKTSRSWGNISKNQDILKIITQDTSSGQLETKEYPFPLFYLAGNKYVKLVNDGVGAYTNANTWYWSDSGQNWNNAPNVITMFISGVWGLSAYYDKDNQYFNDYSQWRTSRDEIYSRLASNISTQLFYNDDGSLSGQNWHRRILIGLPNMAGNLSPYLAQGPTSAEMNPTGLEIAQGVYPYTLPEFVDPTTEGKPAFDSNDFFGDANTFLQMETSPSQLRVIDTSDVTEANSVGIHLNRSTGIFDIGFLYDSLPFTLGKSSTIPRFFEPIDYFYMYDTSYSSYPAGCLAYYRIWFGVQPFNYSPSV